jgi:hypothetical protein
LPVIYQTDQPDDARVKELEAKVGGPEGVKLMLKRLPKMACAVLYPTQEAAVAAGSPQRVQIIMNISATRWKETDGWTDPVTNQNYYDYGAADMEAIPRDGDILTAAFGTAQHEVSHIVVPPGNKYPKWIDESLSDFVRLKAGYTDPATKKEMQSQHYCNGYQTGAYFFEWIESGRPGFVHKFVKWLADNQNKPWPGGYPEDETNGEAVFAAVTGGVGLKALWTEYKTSLGINPPLECGKDNWRPY